MSAAGRQRASSAATTPRRCAGTSRPSTTSEGPATRLQWGASYLDALVDLAPQDEAAHRDAPRRSCSPRPPTQPARSTSAARARCSASAASCWPGTPTARTPPRCKRLQAQLDGVCARSTRPTRSARTCDGLLKPARRRADAREARRSPGRTAGSPPRLRLCSAAALRVRRGARGPGRLGPRRGRSPPTARGAGRRRPRRLGVVDARLRSVRQAEVRAATSTNFEYVNPAAPKGGTLYLRNPDRRTSFDKFNPFTIKGNCAGRRDDLHVRDAGRALGRRAADDVRPAGRGDAGGARQVVDHLPPPSEGALLQRRPGDRRPTSSTASTR